MNKLFLTGILALACVRPAAAQLDFDKPAETQTQAVQAPAPVAPVNVVEAELAFLSAAAKDKDEDVLELVLPQVEDWLLRNPAAPGADEAQLLKADLRYRLGDYKSAIMDLLVHFYEYPQAASSDAARKFFQELLDKKADKKLKPVLLELAGAADGEDTAARLYALLQAAPAAAGAFLYGPIIAEDRAFLNRFPGRAGNDSLRVAMADLHLNMKEYLKAAHAYEKMIQLHPDSQLAAKAKLLLAVVLADNLKQYDKSIAVFQDITVALAGTEQAKAAYSRLPGLAEKQKKYQLAVDVYEEIIARYPDTEEAYNAYKAEARVLREEMDKYSEAVAVLNRLADKYKGEKGVVALLLSAEIYRKNLKDTAGEVAMYDRIVAEYDADPQAPKALYAAGELFDKAKDLDKAKEYYQKILEKYPEDPLSKKAEKRVAAIIAGKP
ncbi:MAG: tetratricopeptide repeat protein [Elusimicrobiales bacterium]|nr:tetratricopeptide repeat protein [Elusimicrobiales bacterium]